MIKQAAFEDRSVVASLALLLWPNHTLKDLEGIFVKEDYRNKGIAKQLLRQCEEWVKSFILLKVYKARRKESRY